MPDNSTPVKTLILLVPLLAMASCDKAKSLLNKAGSAVKDQVAPLTGGSAGTTDPALGKLVDETAEGLRFRKDLPFPDKLEVRVSHRQQWSGRLIQSSAIDSRNSSLNGTRVSACKLERSGNHIRYTQEQSSFNVPITDGEEKDAVKTLADPLALVAPSSQSVTLRKNGARWEAADNQFRAVALAREMAPFFDILLSENALAPRQLWFAEDKRLKPGTEITVTGKSLPMLISGHASGTLHLKFEKTDAVAGHPCGVFSISGNYTRKQFPAFDGSFTDQEVTIQGGQLWLSLLHPLILREELDTIQTIRTGSSGDDPGTRGQGSVKISTTREWKAL